MADQSWFPFAFIAAMILMGFVVSKIGGWFGKKYNTNSIIPLTDPVIKADKYIYTDDNGINHDISHDQIVEIIGKSERDFWDRVHGKDIAQIVVDAIWPEVVELLATIAEYEHALEHVKHPHTLALPVCGDCRNIASSALRGVNRADFREMINDV